MGKKSKKDKKKRDVVCISGESSAFLQEALTRRAELDFVEHLRQLADDIKLVLDRKGPAFARRGNAVDLVDMLRIATDYGVIFCNYYDNSVIDELALGTESNVDPGRTVDVVEPPNISTTA